jgi:signal transduction histidine kinase
MLSRITLLVERQQSVTYERQVIDDGWQQWTIIAITNSQGEVIELQAVGRDITALKESEVELKKNLAKERELGELKSRFVTMASHEFRTPLAAIMSTASFLEMAENKIDTAKRLNRLQKIQKSAREMTILLDDVLTYGKAEAKSFTYQPKALDFSKFCEQIIEDIQASAKQHQIVCVDDCEGQIFWLDEQILRHIVTNLISNAIKYSPQADKVQVWLGQENGYLIFQVTDSGIGIPLNEQKHLFEPFHRATNTQDIRGTGLGLAIVKKAVEAHYAAIEFVSTPHVGTTFTVKIPIDK